MNVTSRNLKKFFLFFIFHNNAGFVLIFFRRLIFDTSTKFVVAMSSTSALICPSFTLPSSGTSSKSQPCGKQLFLSNYSFYFKYFTVYSAFSFCLAFNDPVKKPENRIKFLISSEYLNELGGENFSSLFKFFPQFESNRVEKFLRIYICCFSLSDLIMETISFAEMKNFTRVATSPTSTSRSTSP